MVAHETVKPATPLADALLGPGVAEDLADCLDRSSAAPAASSVRATAPQLDGRTMSTRVRLLREALLADLPGDWTGFDATVRTALTNPDFSGWMIWPVGEAAAVVALDGSDPPQVEAGLALLAALTPRLSSEFAIRPFIERDLGGVLTAAIAWTEDADEHVRRLASEGTRLNLPWGKRVRALDDNVGVTIPILDALYRDPSETVRRSVANHLNDLSRADAELAVSVAERWLGSGGDETPRVVRHALRSLVKQGHARALELQGFAAPNAVKVSGPTLDRASVPFEGEVAFGWEVANGGNASANFAIDYVVHFVKASGSRSAKVFKLAVAELGPGEAAGGEKRHSFRELTTRKHHPGPHLFELQVNGRRFGGAEVDLLSPSRP
jgi:3-methyladenine DNA glycosylase AlkC